MIIDTKAEGAIRLFNEKNWGTQWRLGRTDETLSDHAIDIVLQGFEFRFREIVDRSINGFGIGHERDLMVDTRAMRREFLGILGFEDVGKFIIFDRE